MEGKSYKGPTKRGVRFYLFDDNWTEFRKPIDKVDKVYEEIAYPQRIGPGKVERTDKVHPQGIAYSQNSGELTACMRYGELV